jgi:hydrogenase/urease accessory protein HupE
LLLSLLRAMGHQEPTSILNLHADAGNLQVSLTASTADLAHEMARVEPAMLLQQALLDSEAKLLAQRILSRLKITTNGQLLALSLTSATAIPATNDVRFEFRSNVTSSPCDLEITCQLFPSDPRHRTYLNIYQGKKLELQKVFEGLITTLRYTPKNRQSIWQILQEFTYEGIHHIFIGLDHILFVIGLLLLGGGFGQLLRIISAFTLAHSITLGLATFRILTPSAALVEPVIAFSIIVVGFHAFLGQRQRDPRLLFAFAFGLIHGFGFANVLQEMELPRHALTISLVAFNLGVEIGQVSIILAIAPLLGYFTKLRPHTAVKFIKAVALTISTVGAFWFFQRILE